MTEFTEAVNSKKPGRIFDLNPLGDAA